MATIKSLNISIKASTENFTKGINQATKLIGNFASKAAQFAAGDLLASGLKAAASEFLEFAMQATEVIDKQAKLADSIGTSVQKIRQLAFAADVSGSSFETVSAAVQKMTLNLGKALDGDQALQDSFKSLGISVEDAAKGDAVENFKNIAKAIQALPTPAQQAEAAVSIFGKSATELLPVLLSDLDEASTLFDKLGGNISRVDASQIEAMNDRFTELKTLVSGVAERFAVELSPYVAQAVQDFIDWSAEGNKSSSIIAQGLDYVKVAIGGIAAAWETLKQVGLGFKLIFQGIATVIIGFFELWEGQLNKAIGLVRTLTFGFVDLGKVEIFEGATAESAKDFSKTWKAIVETDADKNAFNSAKDVAKWFQNADKNAKEFGKTVEANQEKARKLAQAVQLSTKDKNAGKDSDKAVDKLIEMADKLKESLKTPIEKFQDAIKELQALQNVGLIDAELFAKGFAEAQKKAEQELSKGKEKKIGTAKEVNLFTDARFGSTQKKQTVEDPQLKTVIKLLQAQLLKDNSLRA